MDLLLYIGRLIPVSRCWYWILDDAYYMLETRYQPLKPKYVK
jgi:hypothetical protein